MAIEKGNVYAMYNLGLYYNEEEKDYEQMKKYYLMAIEKGYDDAIFNLGFYYEDVEKDYEQMKKYYFMAIEKGNQYAIWRLKQFYKDNNDTLGLLQLYIKIDNKTKISDILVNYCNQKIVDKEINSILLQYLNCIDDHDLPVIFKLFIQLFNNQIDLLEAHFKYSENSLGYEEAKQDFLKQLSS
jgi:TPR repeat protein